MSDVFRTATGQTGRDAYIYELAAIRNAARELNARASRLYATMRRELPAEASSQHSLGDYTTPIDRETIGSMLEFCEQLGNDPVAFETVEEILEHLELAPLETPDCPACGGPGLELGILGRTRHLRCRDCGLSFSAPATR